MDEWRWQTGLLGGVDCRGLEAEGGSLGARECECAIVREWEMGVWELGGRLGYWEWERVFKLKTGLGLGLGRYTKKK